MNVSLIGTGNCATILGKLFMSKGHTITQVIGRNEVTGKRLAAELQTAFISFKETPEQRTDLVIVALSDNALPEALSGLNFDITPVMHTAGAVSIHVLRGISANYGVLYPLQSMSKKMDHIPPIPFIIEGNTVTAQNFVGDFALTLSENVQIMEEEKRIRLHAAAVIVNNFTNYLYSVAKEFCDQEHIDFNILKPLIFETAERMKDHAPVDMQTGPAIRKDNVTLDKHLRVLAAYPKLRTMYMRLTDGIMNP